MQPSKTTGAGKEPALSLAVILETREMGETGDTGVMADAHCYVTVV